MNDYISLLQSTPQTQTNEAVERALDPLTPYTHGVYVWRIDQLLTIASRSWHTLQQEDPRLKQHHILGGFEVMCRWFAHESLPQNGEPPYHPPYSHHFTSPQAVALAFCMETRFHKRLTKGIWQ